MKTIFIAGLLIITFVFASTLRAEDQPWQLRLKKDNITVYTRKVQGSAILEFKSNTVIPAPIDKAIALFEDTERITQWYYQCTHMELVQEENPLQKIFYFVIRLPWPVAQRDSVFRRMKVVDQATGVISYELTALPERLPKQKGKVRVPYLKTTWRFTPSKNGQTEIDFQQHSDAGGSIPPMIANALVVDIPFHSLKKFRELLQEHQ